MKKTLMTIGWVLICACAMAQVPKVTLAWDPNPAEDQVSKYVLYEKVGEIWTKVVEIPPTACGATECRWTLTDVVPGKHTYALTAANLWGESGRSNEVSTPSVATVPRNLTITITIVISTP